MIPPPVFAAESLGRSFGTRTVLRAASVWARPGRVTALFGQNGCGKTTLLRAAVGLLAAEYGTVRFRGESYERPRLARLARRGLFYLPDRGLLARRWPLRRHLEAVEWRFPDRPTDAVVDRLGLRDLLDRRPAELSHGEVRRAEVALAVLRQPICLLADEPLEGLSPVDCQKISGAIRSLAAAGGAVVVTGHRAGSLLALADDVVWMSAGATHGLGSPAEAIRHHQFRREYLGFAL
jgi:ABC-type multidrug transport system ATPase subunit